MAEFLTAKETSPADTFVSSASLERQTERRHWAGQTTELHRAVYARDHDRVRALLESYSCAGGDERKTAPAAAAVDDENETSGSESDGDLDGQSSCIAEVNRLDNNGNSALHIAAHWGDVRMVDMLLEAGAWCSWKSDEGWLPRDEAAASGSFPVLRRLLDGELKQRADEMTKRAERLAPLLRDTLSDFDGELKWAFKSWIPLVSGFLPHDRWQIWKRGSAIRVDTRITGFHGVHPTYGDVSVLFTGSDHKQIPNELVIVNRAEKTYQVVRQSLLIDDAESKDSLCKLFLDGMHSLSSVRMNQSDVTFEPASGLFGGALHKKVAKTWEANVYNARGLRTVTVKRREPKVRHAGGVRREKKPEEDPTPAEKYFGPRLRRHCGHGLYWKEEARIEESNEFQSRVWMSEDFPFSFVSTHLGNFAHHFAQLHMRLASTHTRTH